MTEYSIYSDTHFPSKTTLESATTPMTALIELGPDLLETRSSPGPNQTGHNLQYNGACYKLPKQPANATDELRIDPPDNWTTETMLAGEGCFILQSSTHNTWASPLQRNNRYMQR